MKKIFLIFILFIAACATPQERQASAILSMSSPKTLSMLEGKTPEQVRNLMGEPTFVRKEKPNESWVFKVPECAVFVFFDETGTSGLAQSKGVCDKKVTRTIMRQRAAGL
ncbi:MAG: outer membrane protein assembly factor BamE [Alphaproteobacteria bacterium]|nr:outer membrane protein assembly factor BamE [Alphaproteobacteria bacterium]